MLVGNLVVHPVGPSLLRRVWNFTGTFWFTPLAVIFVAVVLSNWERVVQPMWPSDAPVFASGAPDTAPAVVVRRGGALAVVDQADIRPGDTQLGGVYYAYRSRGVGSDIGAVAREVQGVLISGTGIHPKDYLAVRSLYLAHLGSLNNPYWTSAAGALAAGDTSAHVVRPGPLAFLLVLVLSCSVLVRSLAWVPRLVSHAAARADLTILTAEERRWKKLHERRCPDCDYDIIGLAENRCPECGGTWKPLELSAWTRRQQARSA